MKSGKFSSDLITDFFNSLGYELKSGMTFLHDGFSPGSGPSVGDARCLGLLVSFRGRSGH